jgi:hypothetical protein
MRADTIIYVEVDDQIVCIMMYKRHPLGEATQSPRLIEVRVHVYQLAISWRRHPRDVSIGIFVPYVSRYRLTGDDVPDMLK